MVNPGVELGVGVGVCVSLVEVFVDVVVVVELGEPPLIDGFTLKIGFTVIVGE